MSTTVTVEKTEHLPTPLLLLATSEELAAWHIRALSASYERGERTLTLPCHTLGFEAEQAADAVLRALSDFLRERRDIRHLLLLCGDDASFRAYSARISSL